jgi:putative glutamine amidotransferase
LKPEWEGDEIRDRYEIDLVHRFLDAQKPVLGICRGVQVLNVAFGGTLWQDQREQGATKRVHRSQELYDRNLHEVDIVEGSGLAALYERRERVLVNSIHHQAIKDVGSGLVVEARSGDDGIVEAVRLADHGDGVAPYAFGVQWHPEFFEGVDDGTMLDNGPILQEFLAAADASRPA